MVPIATLETGDARPMMRSGESIMDCTLECTASKTLNVENHLIGHLEVTELLW